MNTRVFWLIIMVVNFILMLISIYKKNQIGLSFSGIMFLFSVLQEHHYAMVELLNN